MLFRSARWRPESYAAIQELSLAKMESTLCKKQVGTQNLGAYPTMELGRASLPSAEKRRSEESRGMEGYYPGESDGVEAASSKETLGVVNGCGGFTASKAVD